MKTQYPAQTAPTLYLLTGLTALITSVGMIRCGKRNAALLVAQWAGPLLISGLHARQFHRREFRESLRSARQQPRKNRWWHRKSRETVK